MLTHNYYLLVTQKIGMYDWRQVCLLLNAGGCFLHSLYQFYTILTDPSNSERHNPRICADYWFRLMTLSLRLEIDRMRCGDAGCLSSPALCVCKGKSTLPSGFPFVASVWQFSGFDGKNNATCTIFYNGTPRTPLNSVGSVGFPFLCSGNGTPQQQCGLSLRGKLCKSQETLYLMKIWNFLIAKTGHSLC